MTHAPLDLATLTLGFVIFAGLTCLSLAAFSGYIPWMRAELKFFDVSTEANLWTWANVAAFLAASYAHFCAAYSRWQRRKPAVLSWVLAGLVLAAMSLDDLTALHERLETLGYALGGGAGLTHFAWLVPGVALAFLALLIFLNLLRHVSWRTRLLLSLGCVAFFSGAIVFESLGGWYLDATGDHQIYGLIFHAEEMLEAMGTILFLVAGVSDLAGGTRPLGALLEREPMDRATEPDPDYTARRHRMS